jgi:hypothetical protein
MHALLFLPAQAAEKAGASGVQWALGRAGIIKRAARGRNRGPGGICAIYPLLIRNHLQLIAKRQVRLAPGYFIFMHAYIERGPGTCPVCII